MLYVNSGMHNEVLCPLILYIGIRFIFVLHELRYDLLIDVICMFVFHACLYYVNSDVHIEVICPLILYICITRIFVLRNEQRIDRVDGTKMLWLLLKKR
jgi:hypothetical protein